MAQSNCYRIKRLELLFLVLASSCFWCFSEDASVLNQYGLGIVVNSRALDDIASRWKYISDRVTKNRGIERFSQWLYENDATKARLLGSSYFAIVRSSNGSSIAISSPGNYLVLSPVKHSYTDEEISQIAQFLHNFAILEKLVSEQASNKEATVAPARWKTSVETIEVSPAYSYEVPVPAKFETKILTIDLGNGEFKTVKQEVLVQPQSTTMVSVPAKYESVHRYVMETPATIREGVQDEEMTKFMESCIEVIRNDFASASETRTAIGDLFELFNLSKGKEKQFDIFDKVALHHGLAFDKIVPDFNELSILEVQLRKDIAAKKAVEAHPRSPEKSDDYILLSLFGDESKRTSVEYTLPLMIDEKLAEKYLNRWKTILKHFRR